jgi:zinc protease
MTLTQINTDAFPGPETIGRRELKNGPVALSYENRSSASVIVHGWLWAGAADNAPEQAGLAGLTALMLTRGTERRTSAQIGQEIESLGAGLSIHGGEHVTSFTTKCLVEDLDTVLDILTDCLYHPTFPDEYVSRMRGQVLTAIEQREHNTSMMASLRFNEALFTDHPYGRSRLGYQHTVEGLTREHIQRFYQECYGPQGMAVVIVGALDREAGLDAIEDAFGHWTGAPHAPPALPAAVAPRQICQTHTTIADKTQSDIVLGWLGLARSDPDFLRAYLANSVLGQFGMMGRIGRQVRDEYGLAYYAYSSLEAGWHAGPWAAVAGVAPGDAGRAVEAILDEIERIQCEPVDADELADNKAYIVGSTPLALESKEGIAIRIAHMELYQLGLDYLQRLPGLIESLSAADIMQVTSKYMDRDAYVLSIAGPEENGEG